jgi:hypothetical protein
MFVCYTQRTNLDSRRLLRFTKTKDCCDTAGVSVVHVAAFCLRESAEICGDHAVIKTIQALAY